MSAGVAVGRQLNCPCCATPMIEGDFGGVELDTCGSCRGLWLDGGEWPRVFGRPLEADASKGERRLACPACAAAGKAVALELATVRGSEVEIDHCPSCAGAFLDAGEMQALRKRARPARTPKPQPEAKKSGGFSLGGLVAGAAGVVAGVGAAASGLLSDEGAPPAGSRGAGTPPPLPPGGAAPPLPGASSSAAAAPEEPARSEPNGDFTLRFNCAQCGGPVDADPDDLVLDCRFCGSWSRLLRAKVADACAVDCPDLEEHQLAASWIERQVAVYKANIIAAAESSGGDEAAQLLAREAAKAQAEIMGRRERERLRKSVTVGERRLIRVPYLHEHSDGFQLVLGRDSGGSKHLAVVGFVAEATEPAYDRRTYNFRDRGLRLHRGRLRLLSAKDVQQGFEGLPVADPKGLAQFSVNRERVRPKQQELSELARSGSLHGRHTELVYKPYWLAEIREGGRTEWNIIDGQTGVVAGAVTTADELQRLLAPPGDSPFLDDWEAKAVLVPHRCPECGQDLAVDRKAWFAPCTNCYTGIVRGEAGLERLSYSHCDPGGQRADWFPVWRFEFRSPQGHGDLRELRAGLGALPNLVGEEQRFAWVPARPMLGGLPGDRAFSRFAQHAHHSRFEVVDQPLPPVTQGRILGARLSAEQAEPLAVAAIAASLNGSEVARSNAALVREQLFSDGWSFANPRLVYLPGTTLANGGFQLAGCKWPIPARFGA